MTMNPFEMPRQEAFEVSTRAIIAQGGPCFVTGDPGPVECRYRMEDKGQTRKCAVGHLIPDEAYSPDMEGSDATEVIRHYPEPPDLAEPDRVRFLVELQRCHDNAAEAEPDDSEAFFAEWRKNLYRFVGEFGLDGSVLDEIPVKETA